MGIVAYLRGARVIGLLCAGVCVACSDGDPPLLHRDTATPTPNLPDLRINEVVSSNAGVWVDEQGEVDDYIEIVNPTEASRELSQYLLFDDSGGHPLPRFTLASGARILLWADDSPAQGSLHLPMKISSQGERLRLVQKSGHVADDVTVPALAEHHAYARYPDSSGKFSDCAFASPARTNGKSCEPVAPNVAPPEREFLPYKWPSPWPATPKPLRINEAALSPADFIEIENTSTSELDLSSVELRLAPFNPRLSWPSIKEGVRVAWPEARLGPGALLRVPVSSAELAEIAAAPNFEGVLSAFDASDGKLIDRVSFNDWPTGASLARDATPSGRFRFCRLASPGEPNSTCEPLASRPVGRYLRDMQTPGDFQSLSSGHASLDEESIQFLIDTDAGDTVVFLNSNVFATHYNYVREELFQEGPVDICTPAGRTAYRRAWATFVNQNFIATEGRKYELGSLVKHAGTNLSTVIFAGVNNIPAEKMKQVFFTLMQHVPDPENWAVRPLTDEASQRFSAVEGQVPLVDANAPYRNIEYQPLVPGETYGTLQWVPSEEIATRPLGPRDIVLTDAIPNDIPLIAGLITETFQTPLAHVNVLSRGRGTPNMALRNARNHEKLKSKLGRLIKLSVSGLDFQVSDADSTEALAFWEQHKPSNEPLIPRLDTGPRGVQPLTERSFEDLPAVGGKAAQFAELTQVEWCEGTSIPRDAFAIPVVHSIEHFVNSGASTLLDELRKNPDFLADATVRAEGLTRVRKLIEEHPLDPALRDEVVNAIHARWADGRVRFRSSSNVEDLAGFNGAGLYVSEGVDNDADSDSNFEVAIRSVWSSLWNDRAFSEREYYGVDQSRVAMAVLVHPGFPSERANGVVVTRNVIAPWIGDQQIYINAQVGEALVTNPAPGIESDAFLYDPEFGGQTLFQRSTFSPNESVMSPAEVELLACSALAAHRHFQPVLDPNDDNPWFALDMEFKLTGPERSLLIKQARPYSFGQEVPAGWCPL